MTAERASGGGYGTVPRSPEARLPLLEIDHLRVRLPVEGTQKPVLRDVSLVIHPGEALGLVGESGSGKSMTARAIDRLLPPGAEVEGAIRFEGRDVGSLTGADLQTFRGRVAMVFQDPRAREPRAADR
ncbi:MAG: ATP-binding cassette domain-containing protein [Thermoleophilia bacterium]